MDEIAITLRDAAARLGRGSKTHDYQTLLGFLKSGDVKAGFQFPAGDVSLWVNIPVGFWATVDSAHFREALRLVKSRPSSGAYQVRLADFVKEIGASISQEAGLDPVELWSAALGATRQKYEVVILESEWARFTEKHPERIAPSLPVSKLGAPQKRGWRDLSVIIAVYMVKHHREPTGHGIGHDAISEAIFEKAKKAKVVDLPSSARIKTVVSEILNELQANSNK
jgi:hypothetical protein